MNVIEQKQLVSGRELAKILGFNAPSYIAKLKSLGVLSRCYVKQPGKAHPLIDVAVAIEEIEASADPSKEYVRTRWELYRNGEIIDSCKNPPDEEIKAPPPDGKVISFNAARARKEDSLADMAELDFRTKSGLVVEKSLVREGYVYAASLISNALGTIADRTAQTLAAETSPDKIHEMLTKEFLQVQNSVADRIERELDIPRAG